MTDKYGKFQIEGLKDLERMLEQLSKSMGKTVLRNALKKAGQPIADAATANVARIDTGALRDSMAVSTKLKRSQKAGGYRDRTAVNVFVGPEAKRAPHAHLVEFGTGPRFQKKTGRYTGQMPAAPFMRPAFDATKEKALDIFIKEAAAELLKSVKRLRKRAATGKLGAAQLRALMK